MVCDIEGGRLTICKGLNGQPHGVQSRHMVSNVTKGFGAKPKATEYDMHLSTGNYPSMPTHTAPSTSAAKRPPLPTTTGIVTRNTRKQEEQRYTN